MVMAELMIFLDPGGVLHLFFIFRLAYLVFGGLAGGFILHRWLLCSKSSRSNFMNYYC